MVGAAFGLPPQSSLLASVDIIVAFIGFAGIVGAAIIGGPVMYILHRLRRENSQQHAENHQVTVDVAERVTRLDSKVDNVASLMANHINWHMDRNRNKNAD